MNAAELALLADPKALLAYASSIVNLILNNEISADVAVDAVDTELAAHTTHPAPAEAPAQPAAPVESERITVRHLGNNPVVPVDPDGAGPKTRIEHGFDGNDTDASTENDSTIIQSARELARAEGLNEQQTEELMKKIAADKDRFIAASKVDGYSSEGVTDTKIQKGDYGMATGSGPQKVTLDLETPQDAVTKTYTLSDGTKVEYTLPDACGNSTIKVIPPEPAPAAPAEKVCEAPTKKVTEYEGAEVKNEDGTPLTREEKNLVINENEKVVVVKIENVRPEDLWQDHDKDGNGAEPCADSPVGRQWDEDELGKQEILPGITPEQVKADFDAFEKQNGYRPKFLIYDVTDCDGNNVVACWDEKDGKWSFVYPREDGVPVDADGKPAYEKRGVPSKSKWVKVGEPYIIDTHDKLMGYLNQPVEAKK